MTSCQTIHKYPLSMEDMKSFIWKRISAIWEMWLYNICFTAFSFVSFDEGLQFKGWRDSRFERAWGHEFSHQDDALVALHHGLPGVMETDDVGVLQALQHVHLFTETLPLCLGQLAGLQRESMALGLHTQLVFSLFRIFTLSMTCGSVLKIPRHLDIYFCTD